MDPSDSSRSSLVDLPLELLEKISILLGKVKLDDLWNLCLTCRALYNTIGPSNSLLFYRILGSFDLGFDNKLIKYHPQLDYATLARRKSGWEEIVCCRCSSTGDSLTTLHNWSFKKALSFLLLCPECLWTIYTTIKKVEETYPTLKKAFDSSRHLRTACEECSGSKSQFMAKELLNSIIATFPVRENDDSTVLSHDESEELENLVVQFKPTFVPHARHLYPLKTSFNDDIRTMYRREYTAFHFLCSPEYFESIWVGHEGLFRSIYKSPASRLPLRLLETYLLKCEQRGIRDPAVALNYYIYFSVPGHRRLIPQPAYERDYVTLVQDFKGADARELKHQSCQYILMELFGPGDGIPWELKRVRWPEFLWALFYQWYITQFGVGFWLPDEALTRCPYCLVLSQKGSNGGYEFQVDVTASLKEKRWSLLDHLMYEHKDMLTNGVL